MVGILLAVCAVCGLNLSGPVSLGNTGSLVLFAALLASIAVFARRGAESKK